MLRQLYFIESPCFKILLIIIIKSRLCKALHFPIVFSFSTRMSLEKTWEESLNKKDKIKKRVKQRERGRRGRNEEKKRRLLRRGSRVFQENWRRRNELVTSSCSWIETHLFRAIISTSCTSYTPPRSLLCTTSRLSDKEFDLKIPTTRPFM